MVLNKTIFIGYGPYGGIFCKIEFLDGNLSIVGVEGPRSNGDCCGSCGQIHSTLRRYTEGHLTFEKGWDFDRLQYFLNLWDRWHLNDLRAGSPAQQKHLDNWKGRPEGFSYEEDCKELARVGLLDDSSYQHSGKHYRYGSAWLKEEVPQHVIEVLSALPEASKLPAWV